MRWLTTERFSSTLEVLAVLRQMLWRLELALKVLPVVQPDGPVAPTGLLHGNRAADLPEGELLQRVVHDSTELVQK